MGDNWIGFLFGLCCSTQALAGSGNDAVTPATFQKVPAEYRPTIAIEEGAGYQAPPDEVARRAIFDLDAGGIMIDPQPDPSRARPADLAALARLPLGLLDSYPPNASPWLPKALPGEARLGSYLVDGKAGPGRPPSLGFLTPEWFSAAQGLLDLADEQGRSATYYDESSFPSGSADHTIPPAYFRKLLRREETTLSGSQPFELDLAAIPGLAALIAVNVRTGEQIDLAALARAGQVTWQAPAGRWRIQKYVVVTAQGAGTKFDYYGAADYLDPEATRWFIDHSYERVRRELAAHFGTTVKYTFFDDVGIFPEEKTWHPAIAERFERITGRPAALYYPALWDDIGPDTAAARVGFFKARAQLLGEAFPRLVTEWARAHGVVATGHAPGAFAEQPTDMIGDPFEFYRHMDMPLVDVLWGLGFARGGFKIVSSVAAEHDLPVVAAEAFSVTHSDNGYRRMIELFVRGINHFVIGGRQPSQPRGTGVELSQWAGRSSYLLQGGRHVADIAVLYPIESLQAFYSFDAPENAAQLPNGMYIYRDADYQAVGEMLLTGLHRDFTFVHPQALGGDQLRVRGNTLELLNAVDNEQFRAIVIPGGDVLSIAALNKVRQFYDAGGIVIATSKLPSRSAEFGRDAELRALVRAIFGETPGRTIRRNDAGGQAVFLEAPAPSSLGAVLASLHLVPDVSFLGQPAPMTGNGVFGYQHRQRDGKEIYFFGNSSDTPIDTRVTLRGRIEGLQWWNPGDGSVSAIADPQYRVSDGQAYTEFGLALPPLTSLFTVGTAR